MGPVSRYFTSRASGLSPRLRHPRMHLRWPNLASPTRAAFLLRHGACQTALYGKMRHTSSLFLPFMESAARYVAHAELCVITRPRCCASTSFMKTSAS